MPTRMFDLLEALARCAPRHAWSGSMNDSWLYITDRKEKAPRWRGQTQGKRRAGLGGKKKRAGQNEHDPRRIVPSPKAKRPPKSGLRLTPGLPYSREGARLEAERAARRSMSFATVPILSRQAEGQVSCLIRSVLSLRRCEIRNPAPPSHNYAPR